MFNNFLNYKINIIEEQSQGKHQSHQILSNDESGLPRQSCNDDLATVFAYHIAGVINHLLEFNASQVSCKPGNKATVKCAGALVSL